MNLLHRKIGRVRFACIYAGMLVLKCIAAVIAIAAAEAVVPGFYTVLVTFPIGWVVVDLCMLPFYAARLNDVALSRLCLILLYAMDVVMPGTMFFMPLLMPVQGNGDAAMSAVMQVFGNPVLMFFYMLFSVGWFVGGVLLIYLFFKKGEPDAVA